MQELHAVEEVWDTKKIFITVVATAIVASVGLYGAHALGFITFQKPEGKTTVGKVEGVSVSENVEDTPTPAPPRKTYSLPTRSDIEEKLEEVKSEVQSIDVAEIASSSPQIQKVLQDLKALQGYPKSQVKQLCQNICNSF